MHLTIEGREYAVEARESDDQGTVYWLTGARGAVYFTMRNVPLLLPVVTCPVMPLP